MKNKIENRLAIHGNENQVKDVRTFLRGETTTEGQDMYIDFNNLIKMPEEMQILANSKGQVAQYLLFGKCDSSFYTLENSRERFKELNEEEQLESVYLGIKYQRNTEKYGASNWLIWYILNWGTESNAFNQKLEAENVIVFDTESNGIPGLIKLLTKKFPEIRFEYSWNDWLNRSTKGKGVFFNGIKFLLVDPCPSIISELIKS